MAAARKVTAVLEDLAAGQRALAFGLADVLDGLNGARLLRVCTSRDDGDAPLRVWSGNLHAEVPAFVHASDTFVVVGTRWGEPLAVVFGVLHDQWVYQHFVLGDLVYLRHAHGGPLVEFFVHRIGRKNVTLHSYYPGLGAGGVCGDFDLAVLLASNVHRPILEGVHVVLDAPAALSESDADEPAQPDEPRAKRARAEPEAMAVVPACASWRGKGAARGS